MLGRLLDRLDDYGTTDPDFNEGQIEDRCPVCEWPVIDHPHRAWSVKPRAKWPHRRAAALALLLG